MLVQQHPRKKTRYPSPPSLPLSPCTTSPTSLNGPSNSLFRSLRIHPPQPPLPLLDRLPRHARRDDIPVLLPPALHLGHELVHRHRRLAALAALVVIWVVPLAVQGRLDAWRGYFDDLDRRRYAGGFITGVEFRQLGAQVQREEVQPRLCAVVDGVDDAGGVEAEHGGHVHDHGAVVEVLEVPLDQADAQVQGSADVDGELLVRSG